MLDLLSSSVASARPSTRPTRKPSRRESNPLTGSSLTTALGVADVRIRLSIGTPDAARRLPRLAGRGQIGPCPLPVLVADRLGTGSKADNARRPTPNPPILA